MDGRTQSARPAVSIARPGVPGQAPPQSPAVTDKQKAELFCQSYARVSRLPKQKQADHSIRIEARKATDPNCCSGEKLGLCAPFSRRELRQAIGKLRAGRSPGIDAITNDMLRQLSSHAEIELLDVINRSWREGEVPNVWRR